MASFPAPPSSGSQLKQQRWTEAAWQLYRLVEWKLSTVIPHDRAPEVGCRLAYGALVMSSSDAGMGDDRAAHVLSMGQQRSRELLRVGRMQVMVGIGGGHWMILLQGYSASDTQS